ncbi:MAG: enoyl-CoA hydratase/isomerase family protein [Chloroflexi bacterium]|nr:enoyl-CoA hydratase/isomerase family protein [Chloroflexota bacterium]
MEFEYIQYEKSDGIATIVLDHPPGNTLSLTMMPDLTNVFSDIQRDETLRAAVITGAGEQFFCAGADVRELRSIDANDFALRGQVLMREIESLSKPVIAAINGAAFGGGCELAMSCHLRVAADTARFGQPEINYGLMPSWGGTQRLTRLIGRTRALDMLLTGHPITARRAEEYGLVNAVVPAAELGEAARKLAERLGQAPPLVLKAILECVDTGVWQGIERGLDAERKSFAWIYHTEDARAGLRAFFNKQKPEFKGR